ncbi:hypothetical protein Y032_0180g798 [Ancylostoma ceylanicum]|uniref:Receptor L-domain domain-containing protein n=1 Tax=Ancylostoma ceylanicum TaxID=53326 RepID=A0A016STI4_9BILA|nr:hypothetical protein Y032_0180g798 [Ancylostoma ceylanicum]
MAVGRAQGIGSSNHLFHGWFLIIDVLLWGHAVLAVECDQHTALRKIHEKNFDCDVLIGRIVWSDAMQKVLEKVKIIKGTLHYHHTDTTKLEIANLEFIGDQSEFNLTFDTFEIAERPLY